MAEILHGYSGCSLIHWNGVVRKTAKEDVAYYKHFKDEMHQLAVLSHIAENDAPFCIPDVQLLNYDSSPPLYEIAYISGCTLESLINKHPEQVDYWTDKILTILTFFQQQTISTDTINLIEYIEYKWQIAKLFIGSQDYRLLQNNLHQKLSEESFNPPSCLSHGDFVLDNILVYKDELYLIDPIYMPYESVLWDVAKVLQSCCFRWDKRMGRDNPYADSAWQYMTIKILHQYCDYERELALFLSTVLLRIIPYAETELKPVLWHQAYRLLSEYLLDKKINWGSLCT